ncbi:MAG TPA: hypothetical protein VNO81_03745 [Candidatus Nitrosotenuis sp.]|jgi:phenylpyruvate tautomerase PptA (4-oxalocrotonate tautomerase family)|nr:hypothetical protein [Candidatus Nitrosotenuis sp.]
MPYIQIFTPEITLAQKAHLVRQLHEATVEALALPEPVRQGVTLHFTPYNPEEMAAGGQLLAESHHRMYHLAVHGPVFTVEQRRELARRLTEVVARELALGEDGKSHIGVSFQEYDGLHMACGGRLMDEMAPAQA